MIFPTKMIIFQVLDFFETYAPDLISFIGKEQILKATLGKLVPIFSK